MKNHNIPPKSNGRRLPAAKLLLSAGLAVTACGEASTASVPVANTKITPVVAEHKIPVRKPVMVISEVYAVQPVDDNELYASSKQVSEDVESLVTYIAALEEDQVATSMGYDGKIVLRISDLTDATGTRMQNDVIVVTDKSGEVDALTIVQVPENPAERFANPPTSVSFVRNGDEWDVVEDEGYDYIGSRSTGEQKSIGADNRLRVEELEYIKNGAYNTLATMLSNEAEVALVVAPEVAFTISAPNLPTAS